GPAATPSALGLRVLSCGFSFDAVLKIDHALLANPDESSARAIKIHDHENYQSNDQGHRHRHRGIAPISYSAAESHNPHGQNGYKKQEKYNCLRHVILRCDVTLLAEIEDFIERTNEQPERDGMRILTHR